MSTEHQQYSTENQHAAIQRYADEHGMLIVRTFTDAGKSGVGIHGRDALQELLRIVNSGAADFATILVYDVSRSGRFQDADEAAHYEFQCKRRKITVQYCAEHFPNDSSPMSAVNNGASWGSGVFTFAGTHNSTADEDAADGANP